MEREKTKAGWAKKAGKPKAHYFPSVERPDHGKFIPSACGTARATADVWMFEAEHWHREALCQTCITLQRTKE